MDPITAAAAGGLRARMEALDMLANNLSNANTPGFKRDGEFYGIFEDAEAAAWGSGTAALPLVERSWTDFAQGTLTSTGVPSHLALSGAGLFVVNGPSGPLYTRNGGFEVKPNGELSTQEGYALRLIGGAALRVEPGRFDISSDGTVRQGPAMLGRLELVEIPPAALVKQGASLFRSDDAPKPAAGTQVHQGKLEGSNVSSAESAIRLVGLMRQFEALQKAIAVGGDMNRRAIEELARVGQ